MARHAGDRTPPATGAATRLTSQLRQLRALSGSHISLMIHLNFTNESLSEDSILRINDITGRQIAVFILTEVDVTIDLSQYPSGIYIINYGEIYKRIIIS